VAAARPVAVIGQIKGRGVLIIHGDADAVTPVDHAYALAAAAPDAKLWIVPQAGHLRSFERDPQAYVEQVAGFFVAALPAAR
jgi:uncharacterized protein